MAGTIVDPRSSVKLWDKATGQRHQFQMKMYHGHILEVEDLHFHHDSAVMMPDYKPGAPNRSIYPGKCITGLAVLRACYLHAQENTSQQMIIAGHTDTRGQPGYNRRLSLLRAQNVLYALLGDSEGWVRIAQKKHRVEDYQQILRWIALMWGWTCDPGEINNRLTPSTKEAILAFQIAYNKEFKASIKQDKIIGPQTWGAFFDVYMRELMYILETNKAGLSSLRGHLKFLNDNCRYVGCGENFPIEASRQDEYDSKRNRRVEILFFDPGEEPKLTCTPRSNTCDPGSCMMYNPKVYRYKHIYPEPVPMLVWLDLQTVDEFGCRVPDVALKLKPEHGNELEVRANKDAYWSGRVRVDGKIEVRMADGSPVWFGASLEGNTASGDAEDTVVILPRVAVRTVTDIVVPTLSQKLVEERRKLVKRYGRIPAYGRRSARAGKPTKHTGEEAGKSSKRGGEVEKITRRTVGNAVADNLFIAAGWKSDYLNRLWKYLRGWLHDHHPTATSRGYFLELVAGQSLLILVGEKGGGDDSFEVRGKFKFTGDVHMRGRIGAHTPFEFFGISGNMLFVDMQSASTGLYKGSAKKKSDEDKLSSNELGKEAVEPPKDAEGGEVSGSSGTVNVWEVVEEKRRDACRDLVLALWAEQRVEIVYKFPTFSEGLISLCRWGGTGLLEDYPGHGSLNGSINKRNLEVAGNIASAFKLYINDYIRKVKDIDPDTKKAQKKGLPHPEIQLYKLGPPDSAFEFPKPVGCTDIQYQKILERGRASAYPAWKAVSDKLNEIWKIRSEGSIWMVFEFSAEAGSMAGPLSGCSIKVNWEADDQGRISPLTFSRTISVKAGSDQGSITVEVDPDTGKSKSKVNLGIGPYGFEVDSTGNVKFSAGVAFSEYNNMTRQVGAGIELSLKDQLTKHYRGKGQKPPDWVAKLPDLKLKVGLYMQLIHDSTVMKVISGAPGFWQMRPRSEFVKSDWATLDWDEQYNLKILGWNKRKWDTKTFPPSALKPWTYLSAKEKMASIQLPVPDKDPYWQEFWLNDFRKAWPQLNKTLPSGKAGK